MPRITQTIILLKYVEDAERDRYGNPRPGYAEGVPVGVYAIQPQQSYEPIEGRRKAILTGLTIFAPREAEIGPHDRVIINGATYEVRGEVGVWDNNPHATLGLSGLEFIVERTEG